MPRASIAAPHGDVRDRRESTGRVDTRRKLNANMRLLCPSAAPDVSGRMETVPVCPLASELPSGRTKPNSGHRFGFVSTRPHAKGHSATEPATPSLGLGNRPGAVRTGRRSGIGRSTSRKESTGPRGTSEGYDPLPRCRLRSVDRREQARSIRTHSASGRERTAASNCCQPLEFWFVSQSEGAEPERSTVVPPEGGSDRHRDRSPKNSCRAAQHGWASVNSPAFTSRTLSPLSH